MLFQNSCWRGRCCYLRNKTSERGCYLWRSDVVIKEIIREVETNYRCCFISEILQFCKDQYYVVNVNLTHNSVRRFMVLTSRIRYINGHRHIFWIKKSFLIDVLQMKCWKCWSWKLVRFRNILCNSIFRLKS